MLENSQVEYKTVQLPHPEINIIDEILKNKKINPTEYEFYSFSDDSSDDEEVSNTLKVLRDNVSLINLLLLDVDSIITEIEKSKVESTCCNCKRKEEIDEKRFYVHTVERNKKSPQNKNTLTKQKVNEENNYLKGPKLVEKTILLPRILKRMEKRKCTLIQQKIKRDNIILTPNKEVIKQEDIPSCSVF